jgi:hypothetical protein
MDIMPKDYSHMTPEQLFEANKPYLEKLNRRERLTEEEEDEHYAIMDAARKQMDVKRAAERAELEQRRPGGTEAPHVPLWFRNL